MQIQFPRRIQLGFRPWYGLTLRQMAYLAIAGVSAGAVVLFGPVEGNGLLLRVFIGLGIISVGVALAFFRKDGLTAEQWVGTQIKFWTRPQKRVWTRSDSHGTSTRDQVAEIALDTPAQETPGRAEEAPSVASEPVGSFRPVTLLKPEAQSATTSPAVVLIDMAMALSLLALVVYLLHGGFGDVQGWLLSQVRR